MKNHEQQEEETVPVPKKPLPVWVMVLAGVTVGLASAVGIAHALMPPQTATPLAGVTPEATPEPLGLVVQETPLPPPTPTGVPLPLPTVAPITLTETPLAIVSTPPPPPDPASDETWLVGGEVVDAPPAGVDIASCNVNTDTLVQLGLTVPLTVEVVTDTEQLHIWLTLREPVPAGRDLTYHFLVALDLDGDPDTGRPPGAGHINPELGTEVGAGVFLYPDGELEPYLFIWDTAQGDWADAAATPDIIQTTLNESRDIVVFTFPLEGLSAAVEELSGITLTPGNLKGRTAAIANSDTEPAVVDFCPDLP